MIGFCLVHIDVRLESEVKTGHKLAIESYNRIKVGPNSQSPTLNLVLAANSCFYHHSNLNCREPFQGLYHKPSLQQARSRIYVGDSAGKLWIN